MQVQVKTARLQGHVKRRVRIYSNSEQHNPVVLTISAEVKPELRVEPSQIGVQFAPDAQAQIPVLSVSNLSDRVLQLVRVRATVPWLRVHGVPRHIEPGTSVAIEFEVAPEYTGNLRDGYVVVETSGHGRSKVRIPVRVKLSTVQ